MITDLVSVSLDSEGACSKDETATSHCLYHHILSDIIKCCDNLMITLVKYHLG